MTVSRVSNQASFATGSVSPGMLVAIDGGGLGPAEAVDGSADGDGVLLKKLAETQVLFDEVPAALVSVSDRQIIAIVPYGVDGKASTQMIVDNSGERSAAVRVPVVAAQPGLYTVDGSGVGFVLATNEDGASNSSEAPAAVGTIVTYWRRARGKRIPRVWMGWSDSPRRCLCLRVRWWFESETSRRR